jgi:hypothetical protein
VSRRCQILGKRTNFRRHIILKTLQDENRLIVCIYFPSTSQNPGEGTVLDESPLLLVVVEIEGSFVGSRPESGSDSVFSETDPRGEERFAGVGGSADGGVDVDFDVEVVSVELE